MKKKNQKLLEKINEIKPAVMFLSTFFVGLILIFISTFKFPDSGFAIFGAGLLPMIVYWVYAYSFSGKSNLSMVADGAYFSTHSATSDGNFSQLERTWNIAGIPNKHMCGSEGRWPLYVPLAASCEAFLTAASCSLNPSPFSRMYDSLAFKIYFKS